MCRCLMLVSGFFFFFKQKTAYEMRISDWSSDVCSSDLSIALAGMKGCAGVGKIQSLPVAEYIQWVEAEENGLRVKKTISDYTFEVQRKQIGRASCRERVCQNV